MNTGLGRVRLGPAHLHGSTVVLRPPRFTDFTMWRQLRLRDQAFIEPFWHTSPLAWEQRHTETLWVRECLEAATAARIGKRLATVIEIDGRFAGQVEIGGIDHRSRQGEMGIWIDSELARHGFGGVAVASILDFGFEVLGLERITAPISPGNRAATQGAAQIWFTREARMVLHFDVGGTRTDHDLWAMTRADIPPKGFTETWIEWVLASRSGPVPPGDPTPERMPAAATIALVSARYRAGQLWRSVRRLWPADALTLPVPGVDGTVLRTLRPADGAAWRAARRNAVAAGSEFPSSSGYLGWWREFIRGTAGVRAPNGLLLVIDVDGGYAGEARLLDLDLFDRRARIQVWADPARADDDARSAALRALLDYAFHDLGLFRVATEVESGDTASAAVTARAGLLKEGTMRGFVGRSGHRTDHDLWAVTTGGAPHA
ncbi:MAG: family N-acetyltransferase [Nocardia sp.]|uniref:GNAT family N-acetyltransferase n=1 Tax=Nocardia sp. TaxID=1821 RepID=UPI0026176A4A|nr:GNAT family N-acetyltransferase [Nocardia sp.]MCU1645520.1 family N-acetyltransferase [Nocardia sp.]